MKYIWCSNYYLLILTTQKHTYPRTRLIPLRQMKQLSQPQKELDPIYIRPKNIPKNHNPKKKIRIPYILGPQKIRAQASQKNQVQENLRRNMYQALKIKLVPLKKIRVLDPKFNSSNFTHVYMQRWIEDTTSVVFHQMLYL